MKHIVLVALTLFSLSSWAFQNAFEGHWQAKSGAVTLYTEDQTFSYQQCFFDLQVSSKALEGKLQQINFDKISFNCVSPQAWNFAQKTSASYIVNTETNEIFLESGLFIGTMDDSSLTTKVDVDGQVFFLELARVGESVQFAWYQRSFEEINFDAVSELQKL